MFIATFDEFQEKNWPSFAENKLNDKLLMQGLLQELPSATTRGHGWPWTEESELFTPRMPAGFKWPKITIVTPSYNHAQFLEDTIRSVLLQNYPNLEYFVIDGGSTDATVEILKKYDPWIDYWVSERDSGQSAAVNKGFGLANGTYGNWINSDDLLAKNALQTLARCTKKNICNCVYVGEYYEVRCSESGCIKETVRKRSDIRTLAQLVDIGQSWRRAGGNQIGQQATFFPTRLFREVEGLNERNHYTMDYELWGKFMIAGAEFIPVNAVLGTFRIYEGQKTSKRCTQTKSLMITAQRLIDESGWSRSEKNEAKRRLRSYRLRFLYGHVRSRIGIRRRVNGLMRKLASFR